MSTGTGPETGQSAGQRSGRAATAQADGLDASTLPDLPVLPGLDAPTSYAVALPALDSAPAGAVHEREIRPRRRLRWWQTLPIALLATAGSLMFAFPLAFGSAGAGSAMIGMLGLLLTAASVGWGAMAARHAGYKWPGLPRRGTGERAGWKSIVIYTLIVLAACALALWRVVRLSGR
ncbi:MULTISPECIES: hypothetical protein [unclassified Streptomyces]|uniref:hypothetical protein n=1 Tax=Streptomycetaceae TaxID=2062 RepID=UPI002E76905C|nr:MULTISPECIES: hypothetical protein [unclassified Streptomyces]MED7951168.1 hypothetical protein [Streptomyces sp. BE303]MEE1826355.1 hypothetical protein [Streptomyces sp. BE20]